MKGINKPAQSYLFSTGGRGYKNETIDDTMVRIAKDGYNIELELMTRFMGAFEYFYDDSIYQDVSKYYVA